MQYINYNGKHFHEQEAVITGSNRGLRYGDGLFETLKLYKQELIFPDEHFARLWKGLRLMKFKIPNLFTPEKLTREIKQLAEKNKLTNARIRISVFRGEGGLYDAENHLPNYILQATALSESYANLNTNGLQMCIYREVFKMNDMFSSIKHNNFLPYFMGALYAKDLKCNDAVILNVQERVCDSTIANIFIMKDALMYTPALSEGCVAGIMRGFLIKQAASLGYKLMESEISTDLLLNADEVFLSNSIYNIRWVASIGEKNYTNTRTSELFNQIKSTNSDIFC